MHWYCLILSLDWLIYSFQNVTISMFLKVIVWYLYLQFRGREIVNTDIILSTTKTSIVSIHLSFYSEISTFFFQISCTLLMSYTHERVLMFHHRNTNFRKWVRLKLFSTLPLVNVENILFSILWQQLSF